MMYIRYPLPLRQVEDVLFERSIDVCHETVRYWHDSDLFNLGNKRLLVKDQRTPCVPCPITYRGLFLESDSGYNAALDLSRTAAIVPPIASDAALSGSS